MAKKDRVETWYVLDWKDEAGNDHSMAGPKYALDDMEAELKRKKRDYTFKELAQVTHRSHTKTVEGKDLEVRRGPV